MGNKRGQPGNKSRTGMPKPAGSGLTPIHGVPMRNTTIRCPREQWHAFAKRRGQTLGTMVREAVAELMEQEEDLHGPPAP